MTGLPSPLIVWRDELARVPIELVPALAPWLGRLALAIGPMAERRSVQAGEPDGFTGLARRGSYERLVASEWALADVAPDEFLRRAASGEHLFHELARRSHHGAQRAVAIVSAGPGQLGTPRLAHLALLLVLMRRARLVDASFAWGVLEDPHRTLTDGLDVAGVERLLAARTTRCDDRDVAAWTATLGTDPACEPWWIGGADELVPARTAGARTITVTDVLDPEVRALDVAVAHRGPARVVRLTLPTDATCARLLRVPFEGATQANRTARTKGAARAIRIHGRRLLVTFDDARIECWPLPNSARDQVGRARPWTVPTGYRLIALGAEQRTAIAIVAAEGVVDVVEIAAATSPWRVQVRLPPEVRVPATNGPGPGPSIGACGLVDLGGVARALVFQLADQLLIVDSFPGTQRSYQTSARRLSTTSGAVGQVVIDPNQVQWTTHHQGQTSLLRHHRDGTREVLTERGDAARFGYDASRQAIWGPIAIRDGARVGVWLPGTSQGRHACPGELVGALNTVALVRVDAHTLAVSNGDAQTVVQRTAAPLAAVVAANQAQAIALLTDTGEIVVRHAHTRELLLRLVPGEATSP